MTGNQIIPTGDRELDNFPLSDFAFYRFKKSDNSIATHRTQVAHLERLTGLTGLWNEEAAWRDVSAAVIVAARDRLLAEGRAVASVNLFYAVMRIYAQLARDSGAIDEPQERAILRIGHITKREAANIDGRRDVQRIPGTRRPARERILTIGEQAALMQQPDTGAGKRDAVLLAALLLLGLRIGEAVTLDVADVDLAAGTLKVRRHKTAVDQTLDLTGSRYLIGGMRRLLAMPIHTPGGALLPLADTRQRLRPATRMAYETARKRVTHLAAVAGIPVFSPHDARATFATTALKTGNDRDRVKAAGGWASMDSVDRYLADASISNEGFVFPEELR